MLSNQTIFSDDEEISAGAEPYLATAYRLGFIQGEPQADGSLCFHPQRQITRAEAAVILGKMMNAPVPTVKPVFSDASDIPAWAAPSMESLTALGVMTSLEGNIRPMEPLTRGDTAMMLSTVMALRNS